MSRQEQIARSSAGIMFFRGLAARCPHCGRGKLFKKWFRMFDRCPRCNLLFERIEGHWVGAIGINIILTFGILLIVLVIGLVVTFPDFPTKKLVIINVVTAGIAPLCFYKVSRTFWTAIDIAMRPLVNEELEKKV